MTLCCMGFEDQFSSSGNLNYISQFQKTCFLRAPMSKQLGGFHSSEALSLDLTYDERFYFINNQNPDAVGLKISRNMILQPYSNIFGNCLSVRHEALSVT